MRTLIKIIFSQQISVSKEIKNVKTGLIILLVLCQLAPHTDKYVYVDTKYILEQIPEFTEAQEEINTISKTWQEEIRNRKTAIENKLQAFKAEEILLPEETKKNKLAEIDLLKGEVRSLQKQRFGVNGDLFQKRQELIQPIQEKVYKAIRKIAKDNNYSFVFDKANSSNILYAEVNLISATGSLEKWGTHQNNITKNLNQA